MMQKKLRDKLFKTQNFFLGFVDVRSQERLQKKVEGITKANTLESGKSDSVVAAKSLGD